MSKGLWLTAAIAKALLMAAALPAQAPAADVAVVVGSDLEPYREATEGVRSVLPDAAVIQVSQGHAALPAGTRAVILIGTRAALAVQAEGIPSIYCMAPGFAAAGSPKVYMTPPAAQLLEKIKAFQPDLKRLGVIWSSEWFRPYIRSLSESGKAAGVIVRARRISSPEELPEALRSLHGRIDALWTPMDPGVLNAVSLNAIKPFGESSRVAYYAPAESLVGFGAVSISVSFRDEGETAARAAQQALKNQPLKTEYYADRSTVVVNKSEATRMGLVNPPAAALTAADRVLP